MADYVFLGPAPAMEDCAQVGEDDYSARSRKECRAYVAQIKRHFAAKGIAIPDGFLRIKSEAHDFGSYLEVACLVNNEEEWDLALALESDGPENWDDEARKELGLQPEV